VSFNKVSGEGGIRELVHGLLNCPTLGTHIQRNLTGCGG
jgi:hypothetical protein